MKKIFTILALITAFKSYAQHVDTIKIADFILCELTIDFLKTKDPNLKQTKVQEMDLCADGFVQDIRFENRIGYESALYPGVIFQKYGSENHSIAKIHLTKEFKGYLPNGHYIDLQFLKAEDILKKYNNLNCWTSRGCSDYWGIKDGEQIYYYVKINKDKKPQYPVDEEYYAEQPIEGIDIIADCYSYERNKTKKFKELIILEGKVVDEDVLKGIKPEDVDTFTIIRDQNAIDKYGEKGRNGVVEITLKKK